MAEPGGALDVGARLCACEGRLRLALHHLAGKAVQAKVDVDDLLQEVYVRALVDPAALPGPAQGEEALARFLVRIARHCVVDAARALRAAKREGRTARLERGDWSRGGLAESALADTTRGPATRMAGHEELERLLRAYLALPAEHRRVIGLRQFEGLDARTAAGRMGRSETAVHSLYRRALEAWAEGAR